MSEEFILYLLGARQQNPDLNLTDEIHNEASN